MSYRENPEAIWERVSILTDHVIVNSKVTTTLQVQYSELMHRMSDVERELKRQKRRKDWPRWTEIMTPAQWLLVIFLICTTALGITSPRQILTHFLGEPTEQH
jgi:hypothetical protein